jgi:hypothetical protein
MPKPTVEQVRAQQALRLPFLNAARENLAGLLVMLPDTDGLDLVLRRANADFAASQAAPAIALPVARVPAARTIALTPTHAAAFAAAGLVKTGVTLNLDAVVGLAPERQASGLAVQAVAAETPRGINTPADRADVVQRAVAMLAVLNGQPVPAMPAAKVLTTGDLAALTAANLLPDGTIDVRGLADLNYQPPALKASALAYRGLRAADPVALVTNDGLDAIVQRTSDILAAWAA